MKPTMDDSDSDSPHPSVKQSKILTPTGFTPARDLAKPHIARKLRKERRQQKFLQKVDKQAYKESQKNIDNAVDKDDTCSSSKKKEKDGDKDKSGTSQSQTKDEDPTTPNPCSSSNTLNGDDKSFKKGRLYTLTIAVAGSIMNNAQTQELKAYLAGQVARAAGIFNVDEIVVYDDTGGGATHACEHMSRILQYLETPPYLRKFLFQLHPDLQYTGLIAPLDIPHHLRKNEALPYREGVVASKPSPEGKEVSYINVGLDRDCRVPKRLPEGLRVTVKFDDPSSSYVLKSKGKLRGNVVSPSLPRSEAGIYWGYNLRIAKSLSKVFTQCPYKDCDGYDLTIGTSEKGYPVDEFKLNNNVEYKHVLVVFGGVEGLEYALENDESIKENAVSALFDHYVNTCVNQGSRTIRTEEAILISMTALSSIIHQR